MVSARDLPELDQAAATASLDLTVPTDNRPFFFNQLRFGDVPRMLGKLWQRELLGGVVRGNLMASIALVLILIATVAVVCTILLPLREAAASAPPHSSSLAPLTSR